MSCVICGRRGGAATPVCLAYAETQPVCLPCWFQMVSPVNITENSLPIRKLGKLFAIEKNFHDSRTLKGAPE